VVIPAYCAVPIPDQLDDRVAALTEPAAVALHALERADLRAGEDVLVIGFGPIGAAAALLSRALGAVPLVVERVDARRRRAEEMGLETIDAEDGLANCLRKRLGRGGADVVVESSGVAEVLPTAIGCADRGGRIVSVGTTRDAAPVDIGSLTLYERSLLGSLGYRHHLPRIVRLVEQRLLDLSPLIGDVVPLEAAPETIASLASGPDARIKVLVSVGAG
jgi:(R,R)-butanediol dehydrogenase/meso-butanediol dehydrogenase/diacetyl reductase